MYWTIDGTVARLDKSNWVFSVDLANPFRGISVANANAGQDSSSTVFELSPEPSHQAVIEDSFLRHEDLMVRYAQSPMDLFGFQLDIRALNSSELGGFQAGIEVWLSVQTQLLNSHPQFRLRNQISGSTNHSLLNSILSGSLSNAIDLANSKDLAGVSMTSPASNVVMLVHPTDQSEVRLKDEQADPDCFQLLGRFMEKGVIRRLRFRYLVTTGLFEPSRVAPAYKAFCQSALPLTT